MSDLAIEYLPIGSLTPYARNARTHSSEQVEQLVASITEFGWTNPVLIDEAGGIIAGHGRVMAAQQMGMDQVPCIRLPHLTGAQRRAYVLADNRLALNAGWDDALLAQELADLQGMDFDLSLLGFDAGELTDLLEGPPVTTAGLTDEDAAPEVQPDPVSRPGDVWVCGKHRVMCGDSTSQDALDSLMAGGRADMVFTDPPYNIDYQGVKDKREKIKNDKMSDPDFVDFLTQSLVGCETMYVCCSWQYAHLFRQAMEAIGRKPKAMIVWDKVNPAQHLDKYFKQHEIIFYYGDFGGHKTVRGDVWSLKCQRNTVHPTMKPVELIELALQDQPDKKVVVDSFGGSGSTMIACEKQGRHARLMELDGRFVDVIVKRWQDFTGKTATLDGDGRSFAEVDAARAPQAA
ncbi:MAG: site-specific DNA-methyltransferase [Sulfuricella sp.]